MLRAALLPLALVVAFIASPGAATAQAPQPLSLRGAAFDLALGDDGVARVALAYPRPDTSAEIRRIDGHPPPRQLLLASSGEQGYVTPALLPDGGGVVAYARQTTSDAEPFVEVVGVSALGNTWGPTVLSTPGASAQPLEPVLVGPTGAIAVTYVEGSTRNAARRLALRPALATDFAAPVELSTAVAGKNVDFKTVLGPDGGGAVLAIPSGGNAKETSLRRLLPDGTLGTPIPTGLGAHLLTNTRMAYTAAGTLVLVAATLDAEGTRGAERGDILLTTLPAGGTAFTPVRRLGNGGNSAAQRDNLSVATGPQDRVAVVSGSGTSRLRVFEGTSAAVMPVATFKGALPFQATALIAADGSLSVLWSDDPSAGRKHGTPSPRIRGARRAFGKTFSDPRTLLAFPKEGGVSLDKAIPMPDGRVALLATPYDRDALEPGRVRALITKP